MELSWSDNSGSSLDGSGLRRSANYPLELPLRTQVVRWSPPPTARYKINMDGAVFKTHKSPGVGVLIQDEQGQVVATLSQKIDAPLGALEVEAKAVKAGLHFARDIGISDFIMEGDSLVVYNALSGQSSPPSFVAFVIVGILDFCGGFLAGLISHTLIDRVTNQPIYWQNML
ncbi:uncharacterized protein LOC142643131 [Castanea sativa]|uniref:uncharacterized protein LOC142643131 n=1 Tax=Castanea sativa TaxID=21020 RepID=UPI003F64D3C7